MEQLLQSVLLLSCVGGVLTVALLRLKPLTTRIFGSGWQYCVWLCVLLVMILPVRFDLPAHTGSVTPQLLVQADVFRVTPPTGEQASPELMVKPHAQPRPVDENGNQRYVKRIVTNELGETVYVVTVENQRPEKIASMNGVNSASMQGYTKGTEGRSRIAYTNAQGAEIVFSSGIFVYERTGENAFATTAYIMPFLLA